MHVTHTLKLHGGTSGAGNGKSSIALGHYRKVLETRVKCIMAAAAADQYRFQVPGTSVKKSYAPRWSGAFRANWRVKIGGKGEWSSIQAERADDATKNRYPWEQPPARIKAEDKAKSYAQPGQYASFIDMNRAEEILSSDAIMQMSIEDNIFVYNVSRYAKWINEGGYLKGTVLEHFTPPARFMETGIEEAKKNVHEYIEKGLEMAASMKRVK